MINQGDEESFKTIITVIGSVWIFFGMIFLFFKNIPVNISLSLFTFNLLYLFLEAVFYFLTAFGMVQQPKEIIFGSIDMFNQPCARYDSISGYKWYGNHPRATNIERGELLYDTKLTINNRGYFSQQDYHFQKSDNNVLRFMVFGDSFTGPYFLEKTWTDRAQEILKGKKIELYNFALDGTGIVNWFHTFFREIIPYYEFDGIIIASFGNNLDRDMGIRHHTDTLGYFHYFNTFPTNFSEFKKHIPDMWVSHFIYDDEKIDARILDEVKKKKSFRLQPLDLYFLIKLNYFLSVESKIYKMNLDFKKRFQQAKTEQLENYRLQDYISQYGEKKFNMIDSLLNYCKRHGKKIIFCSIPYEEGILQNQRGFTTGAQVELEFLTQHYGGDYFNGYSVFYDLPLPELSSCFLKYDNHWNQKGSDLFAEKFSNYFADSNR